MSAIFNTASISELLCFEPVELFVAGVSAQLLTSFGLLDFRGLNWLSLGSVSLATAVSFFLPGVDRTIYFHRGADQEGGITDLQPLNSSSGNSIQSKSKACESASKELYCLQKMKA